MRPVDIDVTRLRALDVARWHSTPAPECL